MREKPLWGSLLLFASTSQTIFQRELFPHWSVTETQHYFLLLVLWRYYLFAKAPKDITVAPEPCLPTGSLLEAQGKKTFISSQSSDTVSLSTFPKGWWHMESDAVRQCDGQMVPTCPDCIPEAPQSHRRCSAAGKHSAETLTAQLQPCCGRWASRDCPYQHHYLSMLFTLVSKRFLSQADRNILFSACCRAG